MRLINADSLTERVCRMFEIEAQHGGFARINGAVPWNERFALYRRNYRLKQILVDEGLSSWGHSDPYQIADWVSVFTPIEYSLWHDIRAKNMALWPQLPVGRFFVDFGNPVSKVAVECDGKKWHDAEKDAARDAELAKLGWTVTRIPGWLCHGIAPEYEPGMDQDELEDRQRFINEKTPHAVLERVKGLM